MPSFGSAKSLGSVSQSSASQPSGGSQPSVGGSSQGGSGGSGGSQTSGGSNQSGGSQPSGGGGSGGSQPSGSGSSSGSGACSFDVSVNMVSAFMAEVTFLNTGSVTIDIFDLSNPINPTIYPSSYNLLPNDTGMFVITSANDLRLTPLFFFCSCAPTTEDFVTLPDI